jgi:uncharacterized protein YndB with AHSA1/START domain
MRSPEGQENPCDGCYLDIVPERRLVWTDALAPDFRPTGKPFMTAILTFTPHGAGTHYHAHVLHPDAVVRKQHEEMGFHAGWGAALDQLVALFPA